MRRVVAVVDLQYGSTGKGQIAGSIAHAWKPDTVVTAWGPNAGHTFRNGELQLVSRMLATSAIVPSVERILIGPGSVLDMALLAKEIEDRGIKHLGGKLLIVHPQTPVWTDSDAVHESQHLLRVGSTMKGTAECHVRKIRREDGVTAGQCFGEVLDTVGRAAYGAGMGMLVSSRHYDKAVDDSGCMIVEGAQGFSLGYHTDFYPYCTGRDVSTAQLFADCRLPWGRGRVHVVGVCRTFPIRVANRYDHRTKTQYTSGGCYPDQEEIEWASIGKEPELTTVTQLPRRLFTFSHEQIQQAVRMCNPDSLAVTFLDYLDEYDRPQFLGKVASRSGVSVGFTSQGPDMADVICQDGPMCEANLDWMFP